jgi:DNA-binding transcriptional LysR family regulator
VSLTPDGATYYENCMRVLADVEAIESSLSGTGKAPQGRLRVDMPGALGRVIVMPRIPEFHARYPGIELMAGFGDKPVDLIQGGVDCVIRIGSLQDSGLAAGRLDLREHLLGARLAGRITEGDRRALGRQLHGGGGADAARAAGDEGDFSCERVCHDFSFNKSGGRTRPAVHGRPVRLRQVPGRYRTQTSFKKEASAINPCR